VIFFFERPEALEPSASSAVRAFPAPTDSEDPAVAARRIAAQ
jgi:hypothetical protein